MVGMKAYSSLASPISEPAAIQVIAAAEMGIPILAHSDPWACLQTLRGIDHLVESIGVDRILFSANLPLQSTPCQLEKVIVAKISDSDRQNLLGGNESKLLGG